MPYEIKQNSAGQHCLYKKDTGELVKGSCHGVRGDTERMMRAILANENMTAEKHFYVMDDYVATRPGDPYRLLPFGRIVKGGITHEMTPEFAARFHLPHFKPPIKLGSHDDTTPAGGQIVGLEVRTTGDQPGLWAITEVTDKGAKAISDGDYRYHSPEVIWEGMLENPTNGAPIEGPLIIGDALLHTPHLGEAAALYTIEPQILQGDKPMEDTISVPKTFWERLESIFVRAAPVVETTLEAKPEIKPDEFAAVTKERDEFKSRLDAIEKDAARAAEVAKLSAELQSKDDKGKQVYGMCMIEVGKVTEAAGVLVGMTPEQREWCMRNFKAYAAQIDASAILSEHGSAGHEELTDPVQVFDAAVRAKSVEAETDYTAALRLVAKEQPELYQAYKQAKKEKK